MSEGCTSIIRSCLVLLIVYRDNTSSTTTSSSSSSIAWDLSVVEPRELSVL